MLTELLRLGDVSTENAKEDGQGEQQSASDSDWQELGDYIRRNAVRGIYSVSDMQILTAVPVLVTLHQPDAPITVLHFPRSMS